MVATRDKRDHDLPTKRDGEKRDHDLPTKRDSEKMFTIGGPPKKEEGNKREEIFSIGGPPKKEEGGKHEEMFSIGEPPKKEEGKRPRLSSSSKMQERLLKRLSRRSKECPDDFLQQRPLNQYWSAPRVKYCDGPVVGPSSLSRSSSMRRGLPKTVSAQFQLSLISLVERLEQTNPFFVRCIKSNGEKVCVCVYIMYVCMFVCMYM